VKEEVVVIIIIPQPVFSYIYRVELSILTTIAGHPVPDFKNDGGGGMMHPRILRYSG